jgi:predicted RNA-binding protein with RPS1 domain
MDELIKQILKFGLLPTFLLVILFLIIQDPDRATKIKALITEPFYRFFRWFSKEHISSKVSSQANEFLNSSIFSLVAQTERYDIKVKWVSEPNDPILKENGTLILRLKEENDQTKNILSAVHSALPHVLCPLIRSNMNSTCEKSIDLSVLKKLADKLGKHGNITFNKYFLKPETDNDKQVNDLIKQLLQIDKHGLFVPIFINELEVLGEYLNSENDKEDYSLQIINFIEYLLTIANREVGEEIELDYIRNPFKLGTILLAKAQKADTQGLKPYLKRLNTKLDKGSDCVYVIAFPPAFDFFERLLLSLESHERVFIKKEIKTTYSSNGDYHLSNLKIAVLTKNDIFVDDGFEQKLNMYNFHEGTRVKGVVEDISQKETLVTIMGMRAYIKKNECSWISISNCSDVLKKGQEYDFQIKKIDKTSNFIYLTRRFSESNPWEIVDIPNMNSKIELELISYDTIKFTCLYQGKLEVYIPMDEISWFFLPISHLQELIGTAQMAKVIEIDEENQKLFCSIRQLDANPWINIHKSLPIGREFNGKVIEISSKNIQVRLPNNFVGTVYRDSLEKAGFEYANYEENMVLGQGIDVVVTKVFIAKQRIRLELKRNKN